MKNPIKNNRIVKDQYFALRFLGFASKVQCVDKCSEEEKQSMINYAKSLLEYQIQTATDEYEKRYLKRCKAEEDLKKNKIMREFFEVLVEFKWTAILIALFIIIIIEILND